MASRDEVCLWDVNPDVQAAETQLGARQSRGRVGRNRQLGAKNQQPRQQEQP